MSSFICNLTCYSISQYQDRCTKSQHSRNEKMQDKCYLSKWSVECFTNDLWRASQASWYFIACNRHGGGRIACYLTIHSSIVEQLGRVGEIGCRQWLLWTYVFNLNHPGLLWIGQLNTIIISKVLSKTINSDRLRVFKHKQFYLYEIWMYFLFIELCLLSCIIWLFYLNLLV